jgi:hypothetical protein
VFFVTNKNERRVSAPFTRRKLPVKSEAALFEVATAGLQEKIDNDAAL